MLLRLWAVLCVTAAQFGHVARVERGSSVQVSGDPLDCGSGVVAACDAAAACLAVNS